MIGNLKKIPLDKTIPEEFLNRVNGFASNTAIKYRLDGKWKSTTYSKISKAIANLSLSLIELGIKQGDNIAILSENRMEYYITEIAIMSVGAVAVPLYLNSAPSQIEYVINHSESKFIFVSPYTNALKKVEELKASLNPDLKIIVFPEYISDTDYITYKELINQGSFSKMHNELGRRLKNLSPDDLATIIYTSGTSGDPKGVMLSHLNIMSNVKSSLAILPVDTDSTCISLLPLSHAFEKTCGFLLFFFMGATIAICDNYSTLSKTLKEIAPTIIIGVPKLFETIEKNINREISKKSLLIQKLFNKGIKSSKRVFKFSMKNETPPFLTYAFAKFTDFILFRKIRNSLGGNLDLFVSGGSSLKPSTNEFYNAIGIKTVEGYGLTEASPVVSCNLIEKNKPGTVGKALPNVDIKISNQGEIMVRGNNVMKGYYKNELATKEIIDSEGWLYTGDLGSMDKDGFIKITGRKKEIIVTRGGKNIAPQKIESMLLENPSIKQVIVMGEGRDYLTALIVPDMDQSGPMDKIIDSQIKNVNSNLSNYEKIRKYRILNKDFSIETGELTPTLKIKRFAVEKIHEDLIRDLYE